VATLLFTDTFPEGGSLALDATSPQRYTQRLGGGSGYKIIERVAGMIKSSVGAPAAYSVNNLDVLTNCKTQIARYMYDGSLQSKFGPALRMQSNGDCYHIGISGSNTLTVYKASGGSDVQLGSQNVAGITWTHGQTFGMEIEGTTIRAYAAGVLRFSVTNETTFASGLAGIMCFTNGNATDLGVAYYVWSLPPAISPPPWGTMNRLGRALMRG